MQIHRCMPRPNNWTPASKYFKMPFCLLLIVFRPQCEETRQEHVGVAWRATGPACPQPSSKAIKKGFLLVVIHYQTLCDSGSKHSVLQESCIPITSCADMAVSYATISTWWEERELLFSSSVLSYSTHSKALKRLISLCRQLTWNQQVWMNFVYFQVFMRYVLYVHGEMRNACNGGDSIWPALDWKCGGSAEDRKAPHHLLLLSCPKGGQQKQTASSVRVTCRATAPLCQKHALCWRLFMFSYGYKNSLITNANCKQKSICKSFEFELKEYSVSLSAFIATNSTPIPTS